MERLLGEPLDAVRRQFCRAMAEPSDDEVGEQEDHAVSELVDLVGMAEVMMRSPDMPAYEALARLAELYWEFHDQHREVLQRLGAEELIARAHVTIQKAGIITVRGPRSITVATPEGA